ncbi:MAG: hypothetical protein M5U34_21250 [Chloroflexi bacterium]|nr:hypothetical protein [Chloroflexota bacterium]
MLGKKPNNNGLTNQDIISVDQFDRDKLAYVFARAREMREMVQRVGRADLLTGFVLACLFMNPAPVPVPPSLPPWNG